jgi:hypothetical protein
MKMAVFCTRRYNPEDSHLHISALPVIAVAYIKTSKVLNHHFIHFPILGIITPRGFYTTFVIVASQK